MAEMNRSLAPINTFFANVKKIVFISSPLVRKSRLWAVNFALHPKVVAALGEKKYRLGFGPFSPPPRDLTPGAKRLR
ncbi:MAG: hypothetical protein CM15mP120_07750 [Pseudomonadota bacterium]|nr:MAG: hypothetical protein CM15mP120_07750 [Pseudomonadota bacterium]